MVAATARGHRTAQLASRSAIVVHTISLVQVRLVHDLIGIASLLALHCRGLLGTDPVAAKKSRASGVLLPPLKSTSHSSLTMQ